MANDYIYRLRKPLAGAQLNYGNPLANGLVLCVPFWEGSGVPKDLSSTKATVTLNGAASWQGQSIYQGGSSGDYLSFGNPSALQFTEASNFTIFALVSIGSSGTYKNVLRNDPGGASRNLLMFRIETDNTLAASVGNPFGSSGSVTSSRALAADMSKQVGISFVRNVAADKLRLYAGGDLYGENTDASATFTINGSTWQTRFSSPASEAFVGSYSLILIYNRALSAAEVSALSAYPWQVFQNQNL